MRYKTTFTATLAALLLLATPATTPVPSAAEAAAGSGTLVLWPDPFFMGGSEDVPAPWADHCWPLGGVLVGSIENDTDLTLQLFSDGHCETPLTVPPAGLVPPRTAAPLLDPFPFSLMLCARTVCRAPGNTAATS